MVYGSVCSGIEGASVAWEPLGWKAAWLSEIEVTAFRSGTGADALGRLHQEFPPPPHSVWAEAKNSRPGMRGQELPK
jgi:hypothetical protein